MGGQYGCKLLFQVICKHFSDGNTFRSVKEARKLGISSCLDMPFALKDFKKAWLPRLGITFDENNHSPLCPLEWNNKIKDKTEAINFGIQQAKLWVDKNFEEKKHYIP